MLDEVFKRHGHSAYFLLLEIYRRVHVWQLVLSVKGLDTLVRLIGDPLCYISQHRANRKFRVTNKGMVSHNFESQEYQRVTYMYFFSSYGMIFENVCGESPPKIGL